MWASHCLEEANYGQNIKVINVKNIAQWLSTY